MSSQVRIAIRGPTPPLAMEFHPRGSAVYVRLTDERIMRTTEIEEGALADYDAADRLVGLEIVGLDDPQFVHVLARLKARFAKESAQLHAVEAVRI